MIKSHKLLAEHVAGRKVLSLCSMGKDAVASLCWLEFACADVTVLNLSFMAKHPADDAYWQYLQRRFPQFRFIQHQDTQELNKFVAGIYQSPIDMLTEFNHWEHVELDMQLYVEELRVKYDCEFTCWGMSRYESVTRATGFYKKGLLQGTKIFPLGLMDKEQVLAIAKTVKLHPCYKLSKGTYDFPSYFKMRSAFIAYPEYWERMLSLYPLLELDKYRYEVLFPVKNKERVIK